MTSENDAQKEFWENFAEVWVKQQADLDGLMAPVLAEVLNRARLSKGQKVLDIGCGTGTSTIEAANLVGPSGHVNGLDISEAMLSQARNVASGVENVSFTTADAANFEFEPGSYDHVISRFGVMFFADPGKAFANILTCLRPGGRITMACWGTLDANPWFNAPLSAAKKVLGTPETTDPNAPGPLAFRDIDRVVSILSEAGLSNVQGRTVDLELTPPGDLTQVAAHASSIGPAARVFETFDPERSQMPKVAAAVRDAFEPFSTGDGVLVPAKINFFTAERS